MKSDAVAFGVAGILFGLIAGWVIGSQQAAGRPAVPTPAAQAAPAAQDARPAVLDQAQVNALTSIAERDPSNPKPRVDLANLYFDAQRFDDAIKWYEAALKLDPKDVNVSTDLGIAYYYTEQTDKALAQFTKSLSIDPKHVKTLLNMGIVKAFGKQDLEGATDAWQQVVKLAPDSSEGQQAKRMLDGLQSGHSNLSGQKPGA